MAEAGTLLAIVSLTFQVFSGCVQGYQLLTDAKNMPEEHQYLRVRLKTEQHRLLDWAHVVRLDQTDENLLISNSSKGLLLDVLDQQRRLLHQYGRLDDKYKKLSKPLLVDAQEENNGVLPAPPPYSPDREQHASFQRVDSDFQRRFPQSEALLNKALTWAAKSREYPRKLRWAAFDRTKIEQLVLKLSSFNDFMKEMLNQKQIETLAIKQTRTEFQIMQLNNNVQNLVQIFASAALRMKSERRPSRYHNDPVRTFMQARGLEDEDEKSDTEKPMMEGLAALAQIKAIHSSIEDSTLFTDELTTSLALPHSASEIRSVELSRKHIYITDDKLHNNNTTTTDDEEDSNESHRVEATYHPPHSRKTSVWIEWKTYEPPTFHSTAPDPIIQKRIQALAALLRENNRTNQFRAPHCLGYFRDHDVDTRQDHCRFGLVFEKPDTAHPLTRPISLHTLLTTAEAGVVDMPSLTDRITLMRVLAETIERLHAVNWLHKGLRSTNILFFSDNGASEIAYAELYVSGFDYARPALSDDMTEKPPESAREDIYRHPRVQGAGNREAASDGVGGSGGGYKKSYDIYSLGVLLLEIAYWKPIDQILGVKDIANARPSVTIKVRQRLLDEKEGYLRWVRSRLGNRLVEVVRACLEGPAAFGVADGEDERSGEVGVKLQRGFYERVVRELGDMRV